MRRSERFKRNRHTPSMPLGALSVVDFYPNSPNCEGWRGETNNIVPYDAFKTTQITGADLDKISEDDTTYVTQTRSGPNKAGFWTYIKLPYAASELSQVVVVQKIQQVFDNTYEESFLWAHDLVQWSDGQNVGLGTAGDIRTLTHTLTTNLPRWVKVPGNYIRIRLHQGQNKDQRHVFTHVHVVLL